MFALQKPVIGLKVFTLHPHIKQIGEDISWAIFEKLSTHGISNLYEITRDEHSVWFVVHFHNVCSAMNAAMAIHQATMQDAYVEVVAIPQPPLITASQYEETYFTQQDLRDKHSYLPTTNLDTTVSSNMIETTETSNNVLQHYELSYYEKLLNDDIPSQHDHEPFDVVVDINNALEKPSLPVHEVRAVQCELKTKFNTHEQFSHSTGSPKAKYHHFNPFASRIDLWKLVQGLDIRTTIMLKNIPNRLSQAALKAFLDQTSFGRYDFMYLRVDFDRQRNVGYAFINFLHVNDVIHFYNNVNGRGWSCFRSQKIARLSFGSVQGRETLIERFRNSAVILEHDTVRPKLYYTDDVPTLVGREEQFPAPNDMAKLRRSIANAQRIGLFAPRNGLRGTRQPGIKRQSNPIQS